MQRTARWLMVVLTSAVLAACGGGGGDDEVTVEVEATEGFVVLGASTDGVVKVEAPLGSSAIGIEVTVEKVDDGRAAEDPLFDGLDGEIVEYELGPDGHEFNEPVVVSIASSAADLGLEADQLPFPFFAVSHAGGGFELLETTVGRSGDQITVSAKLDHFSEFAFTAFLDVFYEGVPKDWRSRTLELGETLAISATVLRNDVLTSMSFGPFELDMRVNGERNVAASQQGPLARNLTVVFECESRGVHRIELRITDHSFDGGNQATISSFRINCLPPAAEPTASTEDEVAAEEIAVDLDSFGIDDLEVLDDGTVAVLSAPIEGKIAYIDTEGKAKVVTLVAPEGTHACETDQDSPKYDFGCDWFVWPIAHDADLGCYWVSYPDGTIECIDIDGKAVAGSTISGTELCRERAGVRTEKADSGGQNCVPSQPIPTESGKPSFIALTYGTLLREENGEIERCTLPEELADSVFGPDDITYVPATDAGSDGTLTIRTSRPLKVVETTISWPGCELVTTEETPGAPFELTWGFPAPDDPNDFFFEFDGNPFGVIVDTDQSRVSLQFPGGRLVEFEPDRLLAQPPEVAFDADHSFVFLSNKTGTDGLLLWDRGNGEQGQIEIDGVITDMAITEDSLYASVKLRNDRGQGVPKLLKYDLELLSDYA
jgi:hypothetical protein